MIMRCALHSCVIFLWDLPFPSLENAKKQSCWDVLSRLGLVRLAFSPSLEKQHAFHDYQLDLGSCISLTVPHVLPPNPMITNWTPHEQLRELVNYMGVMALFNVIVYIVVLLLLPLNTFLCLSVVHSCCFVASSCWLFHAYLCLLVFVYLFQFLSIDWLLIALFF